jgi:hypothetical protein
VHFNGAEFFLTIRMKNDKRVLDEVSMPAMRAPLTTRARYCHRKFFARRREMPCGIEGGLGCGNGIGKGPPREVLFTELGLWIAVSRASG